MQLKRLGIIGQQWLRTVQISPKVLPSVSISRQIYMLAAWTFTSKNTLNIHSLGNGYYRSFWGNDGERIQIYSCDNWILLQMGRNNPQLKISLVRLWQNMSESTWYIGSYFPRQPLQIGTVTHHPYISFTLNITSKQCIHHNTRPIVPPNLSTKTCAQS